MSIHKRSYPDVVMLWGKAGLCRWSCAALIMKCCCADNCYPAAIIKSLRSQGIALPRLVTQQVSPDLEHQAYRMVLRKLVRQALMDNDDCDLDASFTRMLASLHDGCLVWEDVSVLAAAHLGVTINIISESVYFEGLQVMSFRGMCMRSDAAF